MGNFFTDNDDLTYYLERGVDWRPLLDSDDSPDTFRELLDVAGTFAADEVATRARQIDREGARLENGVVKTGPAQEQIFDMLREMGFYGLCVPKELGGMNAPALLYYFMCEMLARADVSVMVHFGFHAATAVSVLHYSIREGTTEADEHGRISRTRWQDVIETILAGNAWGSMDLTEANAGSDLAALRTRAVRDAEGVWRVSGNKIFITSGHGQYHLVLAKTEDRDELDALSLFLVRSVVERGGAKVQNVRVDRLEEKLGHHGSATCSVVFDNAEAELIGKVGDGFKLMLSLMNHARIGVGFEALGLAEGAYRAARAYAAERQSMGSSIDRHPMIADYLDDMDVTLRGLRALAVTAALAEEGALRLEIEEQLRGRPGVVDAAKHKAIKRLRKRARYLTPLLKYAATEHAVRIARLGMQIHGGNGYMKDYDAERYMRDSLVLPVYEGTSQIQALMCLKDNLGAAVKDPQKFLRRRAAAKLRSVRAVDPLERAVWRLESAGFQAQQHILWRVAKGKMSEAMRAPLSGMLESFTRNWDPKRDFAHGMLHAERLIQILADAAIAEIFWEQAQKHPERREVAERWVERAEPRVRYNLDLISGTGDRLLEKLEAGAASAERKASGA
jgi:3-(methylthio)propanoyl-CoA dehydrogenase